MTTKIAVFTDAHANLPALEAALDAIAAERCDAIYHTGDAIGYGPYPAEVVDRLLHTPRMHLLMGNHDEWFAYALPQPRPSWISTGEAEHHRWVHAQLDPSLRTVVATWPLVIEQTVAGVSMAFTHYARDSDGAGSAFVPSPTAADLDRLFPRNSAALLFYGHDHMPADLRGLARYVNPGVLGGGNAPLARFAIVEIGKGGAYEIHRHAVPYDPTDYFRQLVLREVPEREFIAGEMFAQIPPHV